MKRLKHEIVVLFTIAKKRSKSIGFVFVDDTNLVVGKLYPLLYVISKVADSMQKVIDTQEGYLKAIGGVIRLDKLFAYLILYKFNELGEYSFKILDKIDINL